MTKSVHLPPDLENRFLQPEGWRWHEFKNKQGRQLRFGTVAPQSRVPDAVVIGLQGLSEYTEKYFEVAHDLLGQNLSFWMMDWQGQGMSARHLANPQKRHSTGFDEDIDDLHFFIQEYVKHSAVHPDVGRIPLVMLGHSMGANIGMRYLARHPDTFSCAAFTAPMIEIKALSCLPDWLALALSGTAKTLAGKNYVGFGNHKNWSADTRKAPDMDIFSSDPVRKEIQDIWLTHNESLRTGRVTYRWVYEALKSCMALDKEEVFSRIKTPCLLVAAGQDTLVDNKAIKDAAELIAHGKFMELESAKHEIMMEKDEVRNRFCNAFFELLAINKISEQLKPF